MKLKILAVLATFGLLLSAVASEEKSWSGCASTEFVSQYLGFGNGAVFYDKPMFHTDISLQHKSGFHGDVWWGTGLNDNFSGGFDDEWDWNLGYANSFRGFTYDVGVGYWDIYNVFSDSKEDILHPNIKIGYPINLNTNLSLVVTPYIQWEGYYLPFGSKLSDGTLTTIGSQYSIQFNEIVSSSGLTAIGFDDGGFDMESGLIWKAYANLEFAISKSVRLQIPTFKIYVPIDIDRDTETVYGASISYSF